MLEIGKSGSVRGVKFFYKAEYCDTPQSKERRNWENKACLNKRASHLLDSPTRQNTYIFYGYLFLCSVLEEKFDDIGVALVRSKIKGSTTCIIPYARIGSISKKKFHYIFPTIPGSKM